MRLDHAHRLAGVILQLAILRPGAGLLEQLVRVFVGAIPGLFKILLVEFVARQ